MRVYPSFLDDDPRPDAAVIRALNEGASNIVVAEVFVSISNHTARARTSSRSWTWSLSAYDHVRRPPVGLGDPASDVRREVEEERGDIPRDKMPVLLVGHGQPDDGTQNGPQRPNTSLSFARASSTGSSNKGTSARCSISRGWSSRAEGARTCGRARVDPALAEFVYFSTGISAESIHSQYDVPKLVAEAQIADDVEIVNLGAWNAHPLTIQAIKERVEPLLPRCAGERWANSGIEGAPRRRTVPPIA